VVSKNATLERKLGEPVWKGVCRVSHIIVIGDATQVWYEQGGTLRKEWERLLGIREEKLVCLCD
jgi:hypothetical protein